MAKIRDIDGKVTYTLTRPIAEGGMGAVYEAEQHGAGDFTKRVAIKIIREEYSAIDAFRRNFVGEAKLVANLIHTNIVQTYHLGEIRNHYYMVMEYVNGVNLEEFFIQHKALDREIPIEMAAFIVSRVCRGLAYAHDATNSKGEPLNIVHRDVNPRNIMLGLEGDVKLTDFGIAKALNLMYNKEGEVIAGKDEYLSPEQARREVTDLRADLFSCGIVLSELLLGYNYFEGGSGEETRENILYSSTPDFQDLRAGVDTRLNDILQQALAKKREDRFQMASEMLTALEMYLYSDGYGPTNEKLSAYLAELYANGKAYNDDLKRTPGEFGLASS